MSFRAVLKGSLDDDRLAAVARETARRYEHRPTDATGGAGGTPGSDGSGGDPEEPRTPTTPDFRRVEADNWLSEPVVVADRWFLKLVDSRHVRVHGLLTTARNLGARAVGAPPFFDGVGSPFELVTRQHAALRRFGAVGVRTPTPLGAFEHDGLGVLVLAYLPGFETLDDCDPAVTERLAPDLFDALSRLHDGGIAHGDIRAENVLVAAGDLYLIDPTSLVSTAGAVAGAYDIACGLATLAPLIGAETAVAAALSAYPASAFRAAVPLLDFVELRPDHDFDVAALLAAIEHVDGTADPDPDLDPDSDPDPDDSESGRSAEAS